MTTNTETLRRALENGSFMMTEPHLSGWRLILGFNTLDDMSAAQDAIIAFLKNTALAATPEQPFDPAKTPGHTDMMVPPESLDAFMEANPLPDESGTL